MIVSRNPVKPAAIRHAPRDYIAPRDLRRDGNVQKSGNWDEIFRLGFANALAERRTMEPAAERTYSFDAYTLDLGRGCLRGPYGDIELRPKSFETLRHLVENAGRLVSKDELARTVWPKVAVTDESVTRCVSE